jgi:hypothetical protein
MSVRVTSRLLRQRFTFGIGPSYTVFPHVLIQLIVLSRRRSRKEEEEEVKEYL